ncbi:hypothetical protein [Variovorax sp. dw_308]|uniref:hypothetical protein n=1 Tax=Variovorax sp. dw_308 TaxID=2721546 RepID=UPI001C447A01|nr:hypothetical protein [Variovorax sp. dw_308]
MKPIQLDVHEFDPSPAAAPAQDVQRTMIFSPFPGVFATYEEEEAEAATPLANSDLIAFAIACVLIFSALLLY